MPGGICVSSAHVCRHADAVSPLSKQNFGCGFYRPLIVLSAGQLNCPVFACAPASAMYNKLYKRRECLQEWEGELANREDNSNNNSSCCFIDSFCYEWKNKPKDVVQHRLWCILWDWKLLWLKHKEWGCWQNVAGCNDEGQEKYKGDCAEYFHGSKVELAISRSSCFSFFVFRQTFDCHRLWRSDRPIGGAQTYVGFFFLFLSWNSFYIYSSLTCLSNM